MTEGMQAGRLEVSVVASLDGFARELKTKIEAVAEGIKAKIKVEINGEGLREELKRVVEEASRGVSAKVRVKVEEDRERLRSDVSALADDAAQGAGVNLPVRLTGDDDRDGSSSGSGGSAGRLVTRLRDTLRSTLARVARDPAASTAHVNVAPAPDSERSFTTFLRRIRDRVTAVMRPRVRVDDEGGGGGILAGLRRILSRGQNVLDENPLSVPVMPELGGRSGGRRRFRMALIGSLIALLQPAAVLLSQYMYGLTALVSAAAPAVGVLGAIPGLIAAGATAAIAAKVAFGGFGQALQKAAQIQQTVAAGGKVTKAQQQQMKAALDQLSPSAQTAVKAILSVSGAWKKVRRSVSERFFSKIDQDIKPLAGATFPLLNRMLGDAAGQLGSLAHRGAQFMKGGVFRSDFKKIAATNSTVIGHMTDGLANLGHVTEDFLVASGPFVERVGAGAERLTAWMRASVQAGRETGSLEKFLDHAGQKASQLGRATRSMFKGFGGVGRAGMDVGNSLLDGLEGTMTRFDRWANSKPGQNAMKAFYESSASTFHEFNRLVGDTMRAFGRAAKNGGIEQLLRQIRTELGPALGTLFHSLGTNIAPALISLVSNLATAIGHLSAAGSGLGVLMAAFSGLMNVFNTLMSLVPGANTVLATLLGTMLALKVVSAVTSVLSRFGAATMLAARNARTLGTTMRGTLGPGVMGPQMTAWQGMTTAYRTAAVQGNRLTGTMRGIRAANRSVMSTMSGLTGALGGPLGLAITGVTIGLGLLASRHEAASRAAQAHRDRVKSLTDALVQSGGAIDANVRAQAAQLLQDTDLADGKGKLIDMVGKAGISLGDLTNAYLGQGTTLEALQRDLQDTADAHRVWATTSSGSVQAWDDEGLAAIRAKDAIGSVKGELEGSEKNHKALAAAIKNSGTGTTVYDRLSAAVSSFSDKTKSADERTQALKRALDALKGNTMSFHDAEAQLNQVMLQVDDTMKQNIDRADGWGKKLVGNDKLVDTSTKNGQQLNSQLSELRDSMLAVATSAQEAGESGAIPMSKAMDMSTAAMEGARKKALALARDMGVPKEQAKELVDQMGFVPSEIQTVVMGNMPEATQQVLALRDQLDGLKPGHTIKIDAPTTAAQEQLRALGFTVAKVPHSKKVTVTAPTTGARLDLAALVSDMAKAPKKKQVTVQAVIKQASSDLKGIQEKVAGLKPKKSITVTAPTATAQKALKELGYKITNVDKGGKKVKITAPNATPLAQVQRIQSAINNLTGRTVHVTVQYSESGKPAVVRTHADGGIVRYAEGGIRAVGNRIKAFAAGAERHIAQIGKPGEMRLWNEPETKGEGYIPLAPAKRKRSKAILGQIAQMFGGMVVYPGQKGASAFANGAVSVARGARARTVSAARASTPQGAGTLVGGDLNLNIGAVDSTATALEDAMFELRRIRQGGSYA